MKFKEAISDANKSWLEIINADWKGGVLRVCNFYKQGFNDMFYATMCLLELVVVASLLVMTPILYPIAVTIRLFKKDAK